MRLPSFRRKKETDIPVPERHQKKKSFLSFFSKQPKVKKIPCPDCGTKNPEGVNYCKECGVAQKKTVTPASPQTPVNFIQGGGDEAKRWLEKGNEHFTAGRYPDAIGCYDRALTIDPGYGKAWNNKALAYEKQGNKAESQLCRQKISEITAGGR
jgi:tetratricopeptide (TPR) repeat protein